MVDSDVWKVPWGRFQRFYMYPRGTFIVRTTHAQQRREHDDIVCVLDALRIKTDYLVRDFLLGHGIFHLCRF